MKEDNFSKTNEKKKNNKIILKKMKFERNQHFEDEYIFEGAKFNELNIENIHKVLSQPGIYELAYKKEDIINTIKKTSMQCDIKLRQFLVNIFRHIVKIGELNNSVINIDVNLLSYFNMENEFLVLYVGETIDMQRRMKEYYNNGINFNFFFLIKHQRFSFKIKTIIKCINLFSLSYY